MIDAEQKQTLLMPAQTMIPFQGELQPKWPEIAVPAAAERSLAVPGTIKETLSLAEAGQRSWEVVVAGAGPAGALTAHELARRGTAVLLVDKAVFPRDKVCGGCLNGAALGALAAAGLGDLPAGLGASLLHTIRYRTGRREATLALPAGVALSRRALDAALVQAAVQSGAAFLPGTEAVFEPTGEGLRRIRLRQDTGEASVVSKMAVAADGLAGSFLKAMPDMDPVVAPQSPLGLGAVIEEVPEFYSPGTIYMACGRGGYVGLVRLEDGRLDVASAMAPSRLQAAGGGAPAVIEILREAGFPYLPSWKATRFRGTPYLTRRRHRVAAAGLFVLGDAAGYIEPFTGEGMSWAMQQAVLLAPLILESLPEPTVRYAERWQGEYELFYRRRRSVCRAACWMRRRLTLGRFVVALLGQMPFLASPWMRAVNRPVPEIVARPRV